jgi:hypothetical protein
MNSITIPANWPSRLYPIVAVWALVATGLAYYLWGASTAAAALIAVAVLAAGLRITELLLAVFTKVREANSSAIALLFMAKLAWWGFIFWLSKHVSKEMLPGIALGFGAFLLAVLSLGLWLFGIPKISPPRSTGES